MFNSIVEALAHHAQENKDRLCIADEKAEYTYGRLWEMTALCVGAMKKNGICKGDYIVVECTQDARFLVCAFACQLLGALFVPVENKAAKERVDDILKETGAKLFLYDNDITLYHSMLSITAFFEQVNASDGDIIIKSFGDAGDNAEVLYTTGTTGKPRGIILTNENNVAIAENIKYGTKMKGDSVELIPLPISHSHGIRSCYANILNGSSIVLTDGVMNVKKIFSLMTQYKISAMDLSPNAAKILLKLSKGNFSKYAAQIDFIQIGTAMLDEALKEELCEIFQESRLYNFYGSTEAGRVCVFDFNAERGKPGCIGKSAIHAEFMVTDENRRAIKSSKDNIGLLAIAGKMNMKQYMGDLKLTEEVMQDGYIYTNDAGYIDENGDVYVLGRNDDVINYKGIKIVPEEIETYVLKYKGIKDCACVGVKDDLCGCVPKIFAVADDVKSFDAAALLEFLSRYIEMNKMPKLVELIDEIPRTYNGKIIRRKLRK